MNLLDAGSEGLSDVGAVAQRQRDDRKPDRRKVAEDRDPCNRQPEADEVQHNDCGDRTHDVNLGDGDLPDGPTCLTQEHAADRKDKAKHENKDLRDNRNEDVHSEGFNDIKHTLRDELPLEECPGHCSVVQGDQHDQREDHEQNHGNSEGNKRAFLRRIRGRPCLKNVAGMLNVAPMTLRQALAQLRELGFVETKRGRNGGTYVRVDIAARLEKASRGQDITVAQLRELTDWRRAISGEATYFAAVRASTAEISQIRMYSDVYHDTYLEPAERRLADARFHTYIAEVADSPLILSAERKIQDTLTRLLRVFPVGNESRTQTLAEHPGIVDAIATADAERARAELHAHIEATFEWSIRQSNVVASASKTPSK